MSIRQIPKKFLPHKITLQHKVTDDLGREGYDEAQEITFVRIESVKSRGYYSNVREYDIASKRIFIDAVNSVYSSLEDFSIGSRVIVNGHTYHIIKVESYTADTDAVHHLEIYVD